MARGSASHKFNPAITEVNGRKIIAVEPAIGAHPHPRHNGRLVNITGVSKVLLDDGTETHVCNTCGWYNDSVKSVASHLPAHTLNKNLRRYSADVARTVVRLVREAEREHGERGKCELVAQRLNERGLTTLSGGPWHAHDVSRVYRTYQNDYPTVGRRTRVARPTTEDTQPTPTPTPTPTPQASPADVAVPAQDGAGDEHEVLRGELRVIYDRLRDVATAVITVTDAVAAVSRHVHDLPRPEPVDPTLADDARKWRQMVRFLGREPGAEG